MNDYKGKYFHKLARDAGDKTVVLMIDSVQNNIHSSVWTDILREKRPENLVVLGVGNVERIFFPHFRCRIPSFRGEPFPMLLTERDLPEVVAFFRSQSLLSEETVTKLCEEILAYTNGHMYPFVKIVEHLLSSSTVLEGDIGPYLSSEEFRDSSIYDDIIGRCILCSSVLRAAASMISNGGRGSDYELLRDLSILHNGALISPFVMNEAISYTMLPSRTHKAQLDESKGMTSCIEQIIHTGLRHLVARDFQTIDYRDCVVVNPLSARIGSIILYAFDTIKIHFQARATDDDEDDDTPGARPQIDLLFHGRFNSLAINVTVDLDADDLKLHLQQFHEKYGRVKEDCVILHIHTWRSEPGVIESLDNDKVYTFLVRRNELYRGSQLIKTEVCDSPLYNIKSPRQH